MSPRCPLLLASGMLLLGPPSRGGADRAVEFADAAGRPWPTVNHGSPSAEGVSPADRSVRPALDCDSLLRNPATGWMLYDDAGGLGVKADEYWAAMDEAARKHASIFYLRWPWSAAEPEEGRYAWLYNDNFKALIAGARERKLRLAFRFFDNSRDKEFPATPEFVRRAGAEGYTEPARGKQLWTPYADDPVFQKKLSAFVAAFAKEFDDPARVDFVDALGLGWWGEGHHIVFKNPANSDPVLRWILDTYATRFQHVLLGWQFGTTFGYQKDEEVVIQGEDYLYRRDGLGSAWFADAERAACLRLFPRYPLYAERCYWGGMTPEKTAAIDPKYGKRFKTWRDMDSIALDEALEHHANTFDLRTVTDMKRFMTYPELIEKFKREGGYRLAPVEVRHPSRLRPGEEFAIEHAWVNLGVGVMPNLNKRWGSKYRPAFALIPAGEAQPGTNQWVDTHTEPGEWVRGSVHAYSLRGQINPATPPGACTLAVAILNTRRDGAPDIQLALRAERLGPWHVLGKLEVGP